MEFPFSENSGELTHGPRASTRLVSPQIDKLRRNATFIDSGKVNVFQPEGISIPVVGALERAGTLGTVPENI